MKKICKKLIICLMVVLILFNFLATSGGSLGTVYAADDEEVIAVANEGEEAANGSINGIGAFIEKAFRAIVVILGSLIQSLGYFVMSSGGTSTSTTSTYLSPFDIFFDTFTLTNVNVFTTDDLPTTSSGEVDTSGIVYSLRSAVSGLFYLVTGVAVAILFVLLALAFIRKFLESTPERKKNASDAIMDCVYSFILVVFIDTFIIIILRINTTFIDILRQFAESLDVSDFIQNLRSQALSDSYLLGWGCTIAFIIICWQTFKFGIAYIMRFFMVSLLIVVAPAMGLFYSHSKSVKGMPGAFNKWFKLFLSNLFIQTMDALLYILCVAIPLNGTLTADVSDISGLAGAVMLIAGVMFVKQGENVLMKLLGMEDNVISMNSVSNGISKAFNTVSTGISIAQGNYSTVNVTSSPVSFGTDVSAAAAAGAQAGAVAGAQAGAQTGTQSGAASGTVTGGTAGTAAGTAAGAVAGAAAAAAANATNIHQATDAQQANGSGKGDTSADTSEQDDSSEEQNRSEDRTSIEEAIAAITRTEGTGNATPEEDSTESSSETSSETSETIITDTREETTHRVPVESPELESKISELQEKVDKFIVEIEECRSQFDDIEQLYQENLEKHREELQSRVEELSEAQATEIQSTIDDMLKLVKDSAEDSKLSVSEESIAKVKEYINSLGADSAAGKYAAAYLDFDIDQKTIDALNAQNMATYQNSIDDAINKGIITVKQAEGLKSGMSKQGTEDRTTADQILEELRRGNIKTVTNETTTVTASESANPVFDRSTLREVYDRQDTRDTITTISAPLRVIKETNPKIIDGKVDISFNRVSEIVGRVEAKYDYEAELKKIKDKIHGEGEQAERAFKAFEDARTTEEQTEAAKKFTTSAQAEGAKLIVEKRIGSVMVSSVVASQTATSNMDVSQQGSQSTRNVLDNLAQRGAQDATTKK